MYSPILYRTLIYRAKSMISGHFIESNGAQIFITQFGDVSAQKAILVLPSIFEEMNLCRAIVAKQAHLLSQHDYCVYCLDYFGCGDSQGETAQADAKTWKQNIIDTLEWIKAKDYQRIDMWGVRLGALLAMQTLEHWVDDSASTTLLLWKPVTKGKQFMTQFLRLKQANSMMQGSEKINWRESILAGESTEVAGYQIAADLLSSLDDMTFPSEVPEPLHIHWFELASKSISPAVHKQTSSWPQNNLHLRHFEGSAFWQIPEIFAQPELLEPSLLAFAGDEL